MRVLNISAKILALSDRQPVLLLAQVATAAIAELRKGGARREIALLHCRRAEPLAEGVVLLLHPPGRRLRLTLPILFDLLLLLDPPVSCAVAVAVLLGDALLALLLRRGASIVRRLGRRALLGLRLRALCLGQLLLLRLLLSALAEQVAEGGVLHESKTAPGWRERCARLTSRTQRRRELSHLKVQQALPLFLHETYG